jgi:hypothetical protein
MQIAACQNHNVATIFASSQLVKHNSWVVTLYFVGINNADSNLAKPQRGERFHQPSATNCEAMQERWVACRQHVQAATQRQVVKNIFDLICFGVVVIVTNKLPCNFLAGT